MEIINPDMETQRTALLRDTLNALMRGVILPEGGNDTLRRVEVMRYAALREFIATYLVQTDLITIPNSLWELIEPSLPPESLQDPEVVRQKGYLSKPLTGSPIKVAADSGLLRDGNPLRSQEQTIRKELSDTQNISLAKVLERI